MVHPHALIVGVHVCADADAGIVKAPTITTVASSTP
jgi:hypothetical protein